MELNDLLTELNAGKTIDGGSPLHEVMHRTSQEALRITAEINGSYHEPDEVRALLAELTGRPIDPTVTMFPPFHTDFGKNITLGQRIFINSGCSFQDQGGITIGDDSLIGHNTVLATLNHGMEPDRRDQGCSGSRGRRRISGTRGARDRRVTLLSPHDRSRAARRLPGIGGRSR